MAASSSNRETVRDQLASLLNTALVGVGKPVDEVFGYLQSQWAQNDLAVVILTSTGAERIQNFGDQTFDTWFYFDILVYVLYADGGTWTEASGEDRRDLIEKSIADVVQDNTANSYWSDLQFDGRTVATDIDIEGGSTYFVERIPLKARVFQG